MAQDRQRSFVIQNEFATVRLTCDGRANGLRLHIEDLESGSEAFFDPLELASLCEWPQDERYRLLLVGAYDPETEVEGI